MPDALVSLEVLETVFANMRGRVRYVRGAKAPSLRADSSTIHTLDCSGFVRYALARASNQALIIPDGSAAQHEWFGASGYRQLARYADVAEAAHDPSRLFIAFLPPEGGHGHVWLVCAGETLECHGHGGVDGRPWDTQILLHGADACYEIPVRSE